MKRYPGARLREFVLARRRVLLGIFGAIVLAHWGEHIAQAVQIYVLGWPTPEANGILGLAYPWLVSSESMHYGYALLMLAGLWVLRHAFVGRPRQWWMLALGIQFWHHIEHALLLAQAASGVHLDGGPVPVSILQLVVPRVELHLFYNTVVTVPMVVAMCLHLRAPASHTSIGTGQQPHAAGLPPTAAKAPR